MASDRLSPERRQVELESARNQNFDALIVGGGVTGCGAALDAASRGMKVCLVEQSDFASGTSSRSSKLIHGGLRYLEQGNFALVREALRERRVLLDVVAPHLVSPTRFVLPLRKWYERPYFGAGVALYDLLAGLSGSLGWHRHLSKRKLMEQAPSLESRHFKGGLSYVDAQIDDSRHTVMLARTAAQYGAVCLSHARVESFVREAGKISGAEVVADGFGNGQSFVVKAKVVLNASGVWAGQVEELAGVDNPLRITASKGAHILVDRAKIRLEGALISRTKRSVLFILPWGDRWLIGTTDTPWDGDLDSAKPSEDDINYLLGCANEILSEELSRDDIVGTFAGFRPLIDTEREKTQAQSGAAKATTKVSREHIVRSPTPGLVTIAGGKYTSYRLMAVDAIDAVARQLGSSVVKSATAKIPLVGAAGREVNFAGHPGANRLGADELKHLIARYAGKTAEVLDLIVERPELAEALEIKAKGTNQGVPRADSLERLGHERASFDDAHYSFVGGGRYLKAEAIYAVTHEGARTVDDILSRRTRLAFESSADSLACCTEIAILVAPLLKWNELQIENQIADFVSKSDGFATIL